MIAPKYTVAEFRSAGLEARWTKTNRGAPIIALRGEPGPWYLCDEHMFKSMNKDGVMEAFKSHTLLGDIFSIPA